MTVCEHWGKTCPACGDRLIHLYNRGPDESSSPLGQWIHDEIGRWMNAVDADLTLHARSTGIIRHVEHKFPGQELSRSQTEVLPVLAEALGALAGRGRIPEESGVFVVECDFPPTEAIVWRVWFDLAPSARWRLDAEMLKRFFEARPMPWADLEVETR